MSAAAALKPFLLEANRRRPELAVDNRFQSCFTLLELTLQLAGKDYYFIGKTSRMDGASFVPPWFTPIEIACVRPDGQRQNVLIDGLGMDACWHIPTMTQIKVIVNSTANEPGPWVHGPAGLDPYDIPRISPETGEVQYRWHNPPMPQNGGGVVVAPPATGPAPQLASLPGRQEMQEAGEWLDGYYKSNAGLQRPLGLSKNGAPDWEGVGAWLFDVYLKARLSGKDVSQAKGAVDLAIKATDEWKSKHQ